MNKTKLIIDFYGGPGCGKSTAAAYVFANLKMKGIDCEMTSEFAKDKVWEGNLDTLKRCQFYVTGCQAYRVMRLFNKVNVIVNDSPIASGAAYADYPELAVTCIAESRKYKDLTRSYFLKRPESFDINGRQLNKNESINFDEKIKKILKDNDIEYKDCNYTKYSLDKIVDETIEFLKAEN